MEFMDEHEGAVRRFYDRHEVAPGSVCERSGTPFAAQDPPLCGGCGQIFTVDGRDPREFVPHKLHTRRAPIRRHLDVLVCPWQPGLSVVAVDRDEWGHTAVVLALGDRLLRLGPGYADAVRLAEFLTAGSPRDRAGDMHAWVMASWREHSSVRARAEEDRAMQLGRYRRASEVRRLALMGRQELEGAAARAAHLGPGVLPSLDLSPERLVDRVLGSPEVATDVGPRFSCGEANDLALAMRLMGRLEGSVVFLAGHSHDDDEGDLHGDWPATDPLEDPYHPAWDYQPTSNR